MATARLTTPDTLALPNLRNLDTHERLPYPSLVPPTGNLPRKDAYLPALVPRIE